MSACCFATSGEAIMNLDMVAYLGPRPHLAEMTTTPPVLRVRVVASSRTLVPAPQRVHGGNP